MKIGMKLRDAQRLFFDRPAVQALMTRKERAVLSKFGAFVRTRAKSSIRSTRTNQISEPGAPPRSHTGALKRHIYFAFDPSRRSVVIGPTAFEGREPIAPEALEEGGPSVVHDPKAGMLNRRRRIVIRARPFMGPAFQAELPAVQSLLRSVS